MAQGKFISYLRVSTDKQGRSGLGIEAQREAVTSYLGSPKRSGRSRQGMPARYRYSTASTDTDMPLTAGQKVLDTLPSHESLGERLGNPLFEDRP